MNLYRVTGFVFRIGKRDVIYDMTSKNDAEEKAKKLKKEIKNSIPKYRWANKIRVERVK